MAQGILIHAGIDPRHAPRDPRIAREHRIIAERTRPSAREIFEARSLILEPATRDRVRLPHGPAKRPGGRRRRNFDKIEVNVNGSWQEVRGIRDIRLQDLPMDTERTGRGA